MALDSQHTINLVLMILFIQDVRQFRNTSTLTTTNAASAKPDGTTTTADATLVGSFKQSDEYPFGSS